MTTMYPSIQLSTLQVKGLKSLHNDLQNCQAAINDAMKELGCVDGISYNLMVDNTLVPEVTDEPARTQNEATEAQNGQAKKEKVRA